MYYMYLHYKYQTLLRELPNSDYLLCSLQNTSKAHTEDVTIEGHESLELEELKEKNQPHAHQLVKAQAKHPGQYTHFWL